MIADASDIREWLTCLERSSHVFVKVTGQEIKLDDEMFDVDANHLLTETKRLRFRPQSVVITFLRSVPQSVKGTFTL